MVTFRNPSVNSSEEQIWSGLGPIDMSLTWLDLQQNRGVEMDAMKGPLGGPGAALVDFA